VFVRYKEYYATLNLTTRGGLKPINKALRILASINSTITWCFLVLEEAWRVLELAYEELERFSTGREPLRLRNACEKGWLAVILATDELLARYGYEKPGGYRERRELLRKLEESAEDVARLGLRDRFGARGYYLHILGYHEGSLSESEIIVELEKVARYLKDVEELLSRH
jgi:hypothetical protein